MPRKNPTTKSREPKDATLPVVEAPVLEPINEEQTKIEVKAEVKNWKPKTALGRKVQSKEIQSVDEILDNGLSILEPEIIDTLLELESELLLIGQAKGKFGGG
jgi:hypothetical protein